MRQIVHGFVYKSEIPMLNKILNAIKSRQDLPKVGRSSLYKFMRKINFKYMKRNRKSILIERDDIVLWKQKCLRGIKEYRKEGCPIYYLDETWVNEGHTKGKVWVDDGIKNRRQAFIEGLTTELKNPPSKGKRLIILHVGSELGFVDRRIVVF